MFGSADVSPRDPGSAGTYPDPVEHCRVCAWFPVCIERRRADDHLSLVAGMSRAATERLGQAAIPTLAALATSPLDRPIPDLNDRTRVRLREQARLQLAGRERGRLLYELIAPVPTEPGRGLATLPAPAPLDLFFDIEADPWVLDDGLEYLLGVVELRDGEPVYRPIWGHDRRDEKLAFERFIDLVIGRLDADPSMHVYHYGGYESGAIKRLMQRHATREDEVDRLLRGGTLVVTEGRVTESLGVVLKGRIALRVLVPERGMVTILTVEPGDVVGWSAVVPPYRGTADAVAIEPVFEAGIVLTGSEVKSLRLGHVQMGDAFGRIDVVVNNAGILRDRFFFNMSVEEWKAVIDVHLNGTFYVSRAAAPHFKSQGSGCYLNMTSTSGLVGNLGQANYSAAKLGIVGLSKSIALDMARFRVRSNCISPFAWSRMIGSIPVNTPEAQVRVEKLKQMTPEKIAPMAVYLCSHAADEANVSGQIFGVRNNEIFLFSQNRPLRSVHRAGGWTPEAIGEQAIPALRAHFYPLERSQDVFSWDPI